MAKEKNNKNSGEAFVKTVSYGTGLICKKIAALGKVTQTKAWKNAIAKTKDVCETVGGKADVLLDKVATSVEEGARDIGKSFNAGMKSVAEEAKETAVPKKKSAGKARPKGKLKSAARKAKVAAAVAQDIPVEPVLEQEIENVTKDVETV